MHTNVTKPLIYSRHAMEHQKTTTTTTQKAKAGKKTCKNLSQERQ